MGQASPVAVGPLVQMERGLQAGWRPGSSFPMDRVGISVLPLGLQGPCVQPRALRDRRVSFQTATSSWPTLSSAVVSPSSTAPMVSAS